MKKLVPFALAAVLLVCFAGIAAAAIYPPGPGGTCPDSVTVQRVQDPLATCHPASGDTIYGVRGVITATDSIGGAYGFWIQDQAGGAYSGAQVFTGAVNYWGPLPGTATGGNLYYGNKVSVSGRALEFNGLTEITDFDNIQGTNDIDVWKVSSVNALPPFHIGTTLELDWVPGWSSANGTANQEPWEGTLVKVRTKLKVGRTIGTGVGSRSMLVTTATGNQLDTLCIDGFSLTNVAALSVGAFIDSAQGVFHQSLISGVASYRILLRGTDDLFAAAPPHVIDGYVIQDGVVRVRFDRPLDQTTAEDTGNYSFTLISANVLSATLEPDGKSVLVEVDNPDVATGDLETISVQNVQSASNVAMTGVESRTFAWGVLSLAQVQQPDATASGLAGSPCTDHSRYVGAGGISGTRVTYTGVVTGAFGTLYYLEDANGALRGGLPVFSPPAPLTAGHQYIIAGQVQEFDGISTSVPGGFTEGVNTQYLQDLGAVAVPAPAVQTIKVLTDTTCDATQTKTTAEDYEGMLVTVQYARVTENRTAGQSFLIAGPNNKTASAFLDTMLVTNSNSAYSYSADSAHTVSVTGVLNYRNGNLPWRITPRSDADIVDYGLNKVLDVAPIAGAKSLQLAVGPNPGRTAQVKFALPVGGDADLGIFDVTGRRLVTLFKGALPAGEFTKLWNGLDSGGERVRAGMYFYRLKVGDQLITTRAIKLD